VLELTVRAAGSVEPHPLTAWDSGWYAGIARNGYGHVTHLADGRALSDYAFFPVLPLFERALPLAPLTAGLVVSWVATAAAGFGIHALVRDWRGRRAADLTVLLWAVLPVAIVLSMAYTEALFTAAAAWALWCCRREHWWAAATLAVCAGLTRPTGAAVVLAVMVTAAVAARQGDRPALGALVTAPLGLLGYLGYVAVRTHDPLGYFTVTRDWHNGIDLGREFAVWTWHRLADPPHLAGLSVLLGLLALLALVLALVRLRPPLPVLVFVLATVAMTLVTSGYFGSKPRYLVPAFPLLVPLALWLDVRMPWLRGCLLGTAGIVSVGYGAWWLTGTGPP
jgi:MFS family permease